LRRTHITGTATISYAVRAGQFAFVTDDDTQQLALVSELDGDGDHAQIIWRPAWSPAPITSTVARAFLEPVPAEVDRAQWECAQSLTAWSADRIRDNVVRLREDSAQARDQAAAAQAKITAMRAYAIARHQSGDICRQGLDQFLAEHDLEPYQPRYTAEVTLRAEVSIDAASDADTARQMAAENLEVCSDNEYDVRITHRYDPQVTSLNRAQDS
jgi:hypothetical protein